MSPLVLCRSYLLPLLLLLPGMGHLWGQHKVWRQYTRNDGLPTMTVWSIIQAQDHRLWLTSDKGIFSFDGYEFHEPVDTSVNRGAEAFFPAEDPDGRIWFSRLDRTVWYIERDTVRAWNLNHVLDRIRNKFLVIQQIAFDKNGDVWLHAGHLGFVVVSARGELREIRGSDKSNFLFGQVGDNLMFGFQSDILLDPLRIESVSQILHLENGKIEEIGYAGFKSSTDPYFLNASSVDGKMVFIKHDQDILIWNKDKLEHLVTVYIPRSRLISSRRSQFVLTCDEEQNAGVYYFSSQDELGRSQKLNILPGTRTNYALFDHTGGLWVSTRNEGVYYCKDPGIEVYDLSSSAVSKDVYRLAFDGQDHLYAGVGTYAVRLDILSHEVLAVSPTGLVQQWAALYYDQNTESLWAGSTLRVLKAGQWEPVTFRPSAKAPLQEVFLKSISASPDRKRLWMSSTFGFTEMELSAMHVVQHAKDSLSGTSNRTFDVLEDKLGRIWVATIQGLKNYQNGHFISPPFAHEALRYDASSLLLLEDGSVAIGTIGGGILIYHDRKPIQHLTRDQGLTSDHITSLRIGEGSTFLACTDAGLNIITFSDDTYWVQRISKFHGLPSDVIHDVMAIQGDLWIGTDKGLVHWRDDTSAIRITPPEITSFMADQKKLQITEDLTLPHHQNYVVISFHTTHFRSEGKIQYRYRLLDSEINFRMTTSRMVHFPELAPGHYTFEVQSQGEDGQWSESAIQRFVIRPPWWKTGWFIGLGMMCMTLGAFVIIRNRNKAFRERTEAALKMKDLELAALRAQINPHFIFNCLGSIQQFIASNDPEAATRYLARFAKLVRLSLHSSVDGKHSLADEVSMLDNYLALEQMRFKGKFTYTITMADGLDAENVFLPSMLLQPFVENGVLHGMKGVKEEGRITVDFAPTEKSIRVVISDNGPGIPEGHSNGSYGHRSVGLSLTHKRLDLISGEKDSPVFTKRNRVDTEGRVIGFEVTVDIPLE